MFLLLALAVHRMRGAERPWKPGAHQLFNNGTSMCWPRESKKSAPMCVRREPGHPRRTEVVEWRRRFATALGDRPREIELEESAVPDVVVVVIVEGDSHARAYVADRIKHLFESPCGPGISGTHPPYDHSNGLLASGRREGHLFERGRLACGELELDLNLLRVMWKGARVHLSGCEFWLLAALADHPHRVCSFYELEATAWPPNARPFDRSVIHAAIRRLRQRLEANGLPLTLTSARGVGFHMECESRVEVPTLVAVPQKSRELAPFKAGTAF